MTCGACVKNRVLFGTSFNGGLGRSSSRQFSVGEVEKIVEEHVRTHMMAGHTAEDILYADMPKTDG